MKKGKRGVPIGAFTSQPLSNFAVSFIDHYVKEQLRVKCYLRNCDDTASLARTKGEANRILKTLESLTHDVGLSIKHNAVVAPIQHVDGRKRKSRKRMRGKGQKARKKD